MPAEQTTGSGESQSLLQQTDELLLFGKGTFIYLEFDIQNQIPDMPFTIYDNAFNFHIPFNYTPVLINIYSVDNDGIHQFDYATVEHYSAIVDGNRAVVCKPMNGVTIDTSKHWKAAMVCLGFDIDKLITNVSSSTGQVENLDISSIKIISYSDTNGTDEITIQYADSSTETITIDKSNLWTVNPAL